MVRSIYEDNHLLVVSKPINMPVQEDSSGDPDLLNELKEYIKSKYNKPGNVFLGLVHRLDRPVGGVMVFARTSKAAARLSAQISKRSFGKRYYAIVENVRLSGQDRLVHHLLKDRDKNIVTVVPASNQKGKKAILEYRVLTRDKDYSLVEINLVTGRSHQIRVQFAEIGAPLWGDHKYGKGHGKQQLALWSTEITFSHPTTKEMLTFKDAPPALGAWRGFADYLTTN